MIIAYPIASQQFTKLKSARLLLNLATIGTTHKLREGIFGPKCTWEEIWQKLLPDLSLVLLLVMLYFPDFLNSRESGNSRESFTIPGNQTNGNFEFPKSTF